MRMRRRRANGDGKTGHERQNSAERATFHCVKPGHPKGFHSPNLCLAQQHGE
jgi:hypothetical protein